LNFEKRIYFFEPASMFYFAYITTPQKSMSSV